MQTFSFACDATETLRGRAYFQVEAETEEEARAKLAEDASEHFTDFNESDGGTDWDASEPADWELLG